MAEKQGEFSITIDRKCSIEIIVRARDITQAKRKAWDRYARKKPKRAEHHIYADEIFGRN